MKEGLAHPVFKRGLINVLKGIGEHGITTPKKIHAPFLVVWDFTHLCNLRCKHCYQDAQKALEDELTTEEAKALCRSARPRRGSGYRIFWGRTVDAKGLF